MQPALVETEWALRWGATMGKGWEGVEWGVPESRGGSAVPKPVWLTLSTLRSQTGASGTVARLTVQALLKDGAPLF